MRNRFALGWAPGRPKARFIKAVSGGRGFLWVSQRIRCKARKNWKTSLLDPFFSTARPPAGFLSFYSIKWIASISNLPIVDLGQKSRQKIGRFSAILRFAIPASQNHSVSLRLRKKIHSSSCQAVKNDEKSLCPWLGPWSAQGQIYKSGVWRPWFPLGFAKDSLQGS